MLSVIVEGATLTTRSSQMITSCPSQQHPRQRPRQCVNLMISPSLRPQLTRCTKQSNDSKWLANTMQSCVATTQQRHRTSCGTATTQDQLRRHCPQPRGTVLLPPTIPVHAMHPRGTQACASLTNMCCTMSTEALSTQAAKPRVTSNVIATCYRCGVSRQYADRHNAGTRLMAMSYVTPWLRGVACEPCVQGILV